MVKKLFLSCAAFLLLTIFVAACDQAFGHVVKAPDNTGDIVYKATLPQLVLGTHPSIVYFLTDYTSQASFNGVLRRYDATTQKSVDVISMPGVKIEEAQLSRDGQWILFVAYVTDHDELRLVRIDGQHLQTLLAAPPYAGLSSAQWSPNQQFIVFDQQPPQSGPTVTYLLDIQHRQLQAELIPGSQPGALSYAPRKWLNSTHIALVGIHDQYSPAQNINILDTQKGANQHPGDLQQIYTNSQSCYDFDANSDGLQLFISSCVSKPNQQGSSSIIAEPLSGGAPRTVFHSSTLTVQQIRFQQPHTLLLLTSNGLWTINTDGSGLTRIFISNGQNYLHSSQSFAAFSQTSWSNVSRDGSHFALLSSQMGVDTHSSSIVFGAFSNGVLSTVVSSFVSVVFPSSDVYLAGWTTF